MGFLSFKHLEAVIVLSAAATFGATTTFAESTEQKANVPVGRLDFAAAQLPEANVEVDLNHEMFSDLFGIGDAALAGVAETLINSPTDGGDSKKSTEQVAQQLEAARQIIQLAGNTIREVHVRAYESLPESLEDAQQLFRPFDEQLKAGQWETLARVRDDENVVRVSVIRGEGSINGIFVIATDGDSAVIANVVCDVSPENVKRLTAAATKVGLENGLAQKIQLKFEPRIVLEPGAPTIITVPANAPAPQPTPARN